MRTLNKFILLIMLMSTIFGCSQQATSEDSGVAPVIPQIKTTPTSIPITPTPINHPLVTGNTPAPINQPLVVATKIPPSIFVPKLIDDGVPELIASVNDRFFDGILEGDGVVTIGESTIEALIDSRDRVLISYRMPSLMSKLRKGSFNGQLSLKHSRSIGGSHKETKIYENGTVFLANIIDFSPNPLGSIVITNDLTLVQSAVQSNPDQMTVPAPVTANVASPKNIPIALGVPTIISTPTGSFEIYLESSYLYTSDEPGSDAPGGYNMQVWILKVGS
jgi:hypothetical protein